MATHDYVIANGSGAAVRSDLNNALAAIVSNNSSSTEPATTYAYQWWADTNANVLKIRNSANNAWITLRELDGTMLIEDGSASTPGLAFADDTNTGIFSGAADQINFATGGAERLKIDGTETVFNNPSNDVDFRVESNGQTHMLYVNAGDDRIGIGHSSPGVTLDVNGEVRSHHASDSRFLLEVNDVNRGGFSATTDAGVVIYGASSTNPIRFQTSGSEKARIDTDGRLLVGTTTDKSISSDANALVQIFTATAGKLLVGRSDASVVANDFLGIIDFHTFDGGSQRGARIAAVADGDHASGDVPSRIEFSTCADGSSTLTERLRIDSDGALMSAAGTSTASTTDNHHQFHTSFNNYGIRIKTHNTSQTADSIRGENNRSASQNFSLLRLFSGDGSTNGANDAEFRFRGDGSAFADGDWNTGGADYAEYFEWSDGNASEEDRRGISVVLVDDKIREAVAGEDPIGVISGNPSVVGDAAWSKWNGKHLRDDFGSYLTDTHNVVKWTETVTDDDGNETTQEHVYEDWNIPDGIVVPDDAVVSATDENGKPFTHRRLNPDYDPDVTYVPREDRAEWDCVGLMGKLRIRKGQVTGSRWIKMRDVSATVEEWLVR